MVTIVRGINKQLMRELREILKDKFIDYFPFPEIIYYDTEAIYSEIMIDFASHMALVLGFDSEYSYKIYYHKRGVQVPITPPSRSEGKCFTPVKVIIPQTARPDSGHDYLYVYSDIITPTRFGKKFS